MMHCCNGTCPMYDAENGECCATDEPRVSVKPDAECFFDAYERDNPFVPPKPTNADRIRSMTDEELAEWIYNRIRITLERAGFSIDEDIPNEDVVKSTLDWLKQPAKEE